MPRSLSGAETNGSGNVLVELNHWSLSGREVSCDSPLAELKPTSLSFQQYTVQSKFAIGY